ncbi:uncharacterized protein SCHCODRAFT_02574053 [Schizophyllum commune H4-8]|nr:uncharacterized protein SCHCODRAFT_02574053 [Schizophyllum commune H4-8]KAI5893031.1 hypothetical protein SCHCODRAFT_02574053 [Schizophyllum commune H4-8]
MHNVLHRSAYGLERIIENVYEHHHPRNRYYDIKALSKSPILGCSEPLDRLKLARAVCKAFGHFIDVHSLVDVHPSASGQIYSGSERSVL